MLFFLYRCVKVIYPWQFLKTTGSTLTNGVGMPRKNIKHQVVAVPYNLSGAAEFLSQIGKEQRAIDTIQLELNNKIDELKLEAMNKVKSHREKINQLVEGLFAWADVYRDELTEKGKRKTVELPTGIFGWRMTPPAVSLRNVKKILETIKALGLTQFIRTKEEINKEAMLKEPDVAKKIRGVSISQHRQC